MQASEPEGSECRHCFPPPRQAFVDIGVGATLTGKNLDSADGLSAIAILVPRDLDERPLPVLRGERHKQAPSRTE
jgi:hypothetical protein